MALHFARFFFFFFSFRFQKYVLYQKTATLKEKNWITIYQKNIIIKLESFERNYSVKCYLLALNDQFA